MSYVDQAEGSPMALDPSNSSGAGGQNPPQDPNDPGLGARPKLYSNVIVDDSPLQNQMRKNAECKTWKFSSKSAFQLLNFRMSKIFEGGVEQWKKFFATENLAGNQRGIKHTPNKNSLAAPDFFLGGGGEFEQKNQRLFFLATLFKFNNVN